MIGIVVGLEAEAAIARRLGCPVAVGGGTHAGALAAASSLVGNGVTMLVSFGLAGGLRPGLAAGTVLSAAWVVDHDGIRYPTHAPLASRLGSVAGTMLAAREIIGAAAEKTAAWHATQADAVDLETSAIIAVADGRPIAVLRAVCDPAERTLPPAARLALDAHGRIALGGVLMSVACDPSQIGGLIALGRDAAAARRALSERVLSLSKCLRDGF